VIKLSKNVMKSASDCAGYCLEFRGT